MNHLVFRRVIDLPSPSDNDRRADDRRIKETLGLEPLSIPLSLLRRIPALKETNNLSFIIGRDNSGYKLIDISRGKSFSIALDLGTTNLVAALLDNDNGLEVMTTSVENPQIAFGSDILTRMHHAMSPRADEVYKKLLEGINAVIALICEKSGIEREEIHAMSAAGNTVMSHFFLGLDISTIPVEPFVPLVKSPGFFSARELLLDINSEACVFVFPNAGSYVGGDTVAGIISSGIYNSENISVLIDVGTNAEVVVGNRDWMLVGAGAAGPALEEGISTVGRRATKGIIYDFHIGDDVECSTFDNASPEGICGSGMVSLLYELYRSGIINSSGVLNPSAGFIVTIEGENAFRIFCNGDGPLYVRQSEINNFMKSKAAMFTLLLVLVRSVGIGFGDVKDVFVAGALGTGIDPGKAVGIGMLPEWPVERIKPLGNSSLEGAKMLLRDAGLLEQINSVSEKITYKHMHDDPEFMKEFMGAVFIPHTNPELLKA